MLSFQQQLLTSNREKRSKFEDGMELALEMFDDYGGTLCILIFVNSCEYSACHTGQIIAFTNGHSSMTSISSLTPQNDSIASLFAYDNLEINIVTPNPYKCSGKMTEDCWNFDFSEELSKSTILSMNSQSHMAYLRSRPHHSKLRII